jgi:hypothetical protein
MPEQLDQQVLDAIDRLVGSCIDERIHDIDLGEKPGEKKILKTFFDEAKLTAEIAENLRTEIKDALRQLYPPREGQPLTPRKTAHARAFRQQADMLSFDVLKEHINKRLESRIKDFAKQWSDVVRKRWNTKEPHPGSDEPRQAPTIEPRLFLWL